MDEKSQKRARSRGYPAMNLEGVIEMAQTLKASLGRGGHDREQIAEALGLGVGTVNRRIAAMVHYGLMALVKGEHGTYELTDLGNRILSPRTDLEKQLAIQEAALNPNLFQEIYGRYAGSTLPGLLSNVVERDFGITHKQAPDAARIFRETMDFSSYHIDDQLLREPSVVEPTTPAGLVGTPAPEVQISKPPDSMGSERRMQGSALPDGYKEFQIILDLDRSAYLRVPEPVNEEDLDSVSEWIVFTKKRLRKVSPTDSAN